jgi:hypothetical protein
LGAAAENFVSFYLIMFVYVIFYYAYAPAPWICVSFNFLLVGISEAEILAWVGKGKLSS